MTKSKHTFYFLSILMFHVLSTEPAQAITIDIENHLRTITGSAEEKSIPFAERTDLETVKKTISKFYYTNWTDKQLDIQIGVAANSIILLINNKQDDYTEYSVSLKDNNGKVIKGTEGLLAPFEAEHISGIYLPQWLLKGKKAPWSLSIQHTKKTLSLNIEKLYNIKPVKQSKKSKMLDDELNLIKESSFIPEILYGHDLYGKKIGTISLNKFDALLNKFEIKKEQAKIPDSLRKYLYLERVYPLPKLTIYRNKRYPNITYYYYDESEFAGIELFGVAYQVLLKVEGNSVSRIFEHKSNTQDFYAYDFFSVHYFKSENETLVKGIMMGGVAANGFIAGLKGGQLHNIKYSFHHEEGSSGTVCSENPFPCDE